MTDLKTNDLTADIENIKSARTWDALKILYRQLLKKYKGELPGLLFSTLNESAKNLNLVFVNQEIVDLQNAVDFSRHRKTSGTGRLDVLPETESAIKDFIEDLNGANYHVVRNEFRYPDDYGWLTSDHTAQYDRSVDSINYIYAGYHDERDLDLDDSAVWEEDIYYCDGNYLIEADPEVELEKNFAELLSGLEFLLAKVGGRRVDIELEVPKYLLPLASVYEIRMIDFLNKHGYMPRICTAVETTECALDGKACISVRYIQFGLKEKLTTYDDESNRLFLGYIKKTQNIQFDLDNYQAFEWIDRGDYGVKTYESNGESLIESINSVSVEFSHILQEAREILLIVKSQTDFSMDIPDNVRQNIIERFGNNTRFCILNGFEEGTGIDQIDIYFRGRQSTHYD